MNYEEMLEYVKKILEVSNKIKPNNPYHQFRDRFMHTFRVYKWIEKIIGDFPDCNKDVAYTAAIFHDVGYSVVKEHHEVHSAAIFRRYSENNGFDEDFINKTAYVIENHSNKDQLDDDNIPAELKLLLEADLLDEEGALAITWDLLAKGAKGIDSYYEAIDALKIHSGHILNQNFNFSPIAKRYWEEKKEFVRMFMNMLRDDLFITED